MHSWDMYPINFYEKRDLFVLNFVMRNSSVLKGEFTLLKEFCFQVHRGERRVAFYVVKNNVNHTKRAAMRSRNYSDSESVELEESDPLESEELEEDKRPVLVLFPS